MSTNTDKAAFRDDRAQRTTSQITVLICTHNRAALLERTIRHLNQARRPSGCEVEILVVANACSDATEHYLRDYGTAPEGLPLRWTSEPIPGKSNALNRAIRLVESPLTAFVDDDHRVDEGFLEAIVTATRNHPEVEVFCGRILPDWDGSEPEWVHDVGPYRIYPLPVPRFDKGDEPLDMADDEPLPGGGNLFLRTDLFGRVGDFSPSFGPVGHNLGGAEDLEWLSRALRQGARLRYEPTVIQYHYVDQERLTLPYLMHKAYERSASMIRLGDHPAAVPLFAYRKALGYLGRVLFGFSWTQRRFYLVRLAAALGEIKGFLQIRRPGPRHDTGRRRSDS